MTLATLPEPLSTRSEDEVFEAAWQRLLLMLDNTKQFSTLFVFSGNQVLELALQQRLQQAVQVHGVAWHLLPAWNETPEGQAQRKQQAQTWPMPTPALTWAHMMAQQIVRDVLQTVFPNSEQAQPNGSILWFDLRNRLGRLVVAWLNVLQELSVHTDATYAQVLKQSQQLLLARLNERRAQLSQLGPCVLVLPLEATKTTAMYAPDLWTIRLSSLYLQGFLGPLPVQNQPQTNPADLEIGVDPGSVLPSHIEVLKRWQQAFLEKNTDHLLVSDGWLAVDTCIRWGQGLDAALRIAQQCVNLAYIRGNLREQLVSQGWLGEVHQKLGHLEEALAAYRVCLLLAEQGASAAPENSDWQRDLSVSFEKVANILAAQGEREQALQQHQKSLAIHEKLAASDPKNSDWQRDLSVSFDNVADILAAQGEREQALRQYQKSLAIHEKLAASDPQNSDWQRDLSVSFSKVADILAAQGEREQALMYYHKDLAIAEKLAASDPKNSDWQRDLSVSYEKVANILAAQGEREQALQQYQKGLAIREKLAASDPKNSDWQRDLSVSFNKVASILEAQGQREQALQQYQKGLAIREKLAASDPKNSDWQRDLSVSYDNVANILAAQGEREQALQQYQKSLAIAEKLAASDPSNVNWQTDLVVSYVRLGGFEQSGSKRNTWYDQALTVLTTLDAKDALSAEQKTWIPFITNEKAKWASMAHRDPHL